MSTCVFFFFLSSFDSVAIQTRIHSGGSPYGAGGAVHRSCMSLLLTRASVAHAASLTNRFFPWQVPEIDLTGAASDDDDVLPEEGNNAEGEGVRGREEEQEGQGANGNDHEATEGAEDKGNKRTKKRGAGASHPESLKLQMPEKVAKAKILVETEATEATDLEGDVGVVGRAQRSDTSGNSQLDLKGVIYDCHVLPAKSSMAVIHVSGSEAKVEAVFNDFVRLEESDSGRHLVSGREHEKHLAQKLAPASDDSNEGETEVPSTSKGKGKGARLLAGRGVSKNKGGRKGPQKKGGTAKK